MHNSILVSQNLRELIENKVITSTSSIKESQIQPASLDLTLSEYAYEIKESFLPKRGQTIESILKKESIKKFNLNKNNELLSGNIYLIPLQESLALLPSQEGKSNPKSSIGRIDLFVRLIADSYPAFDRIPKGYTGKLYLLTIPQSFNVLASPGLSLNQLRIFEGSPRLNDYELHLALRKNNLIYYGNNVANAKEINIDGGIYLTININKGVVAYRSKSVKTPIDLSKDKSHKITDFWDIIESKNDAITIEQDKFYLLTPKEKVRIPLNLAGDLEAINEEFGDFRSHYAGFFDPGFGYGEDGSVKGTHVTLEVRPLKHSFKLNDRKFMCRIIYERTSQMPDKVYGSVKIGSHYLRQAGINPGKYFAP